MILVTGGAGFIGSNFILHWLASHREPVINLDLLTYAGNLSYLKAVQSDERYTFIQGDIGDTALLADIFKCRPVRAVINFAAESHVDRSISGSRQFIQTNVVGTMNLLQSTLQYWQQLTSEDQDNFRFLHISTDEVYGSLCAQDSAFTENNRISPNSPYSASKAASDHLVRAWCHTYGLPTLTSNCSNNYGPHQHIEKLIPMCITRALVGNTIPIYGDGKNIRDWLYVVDHCRAIDTILEKGCVGETYNVGGYNERSNLDVVEQLLLLLDELRPLTGGKRYREQITFVKDREGHDRRYAINADKIKQDLGWVPLETFHSGFEKTVQWYLAAGHN